MKFGEHWLQPIQARLEKKYSFLSRNELDNYNLVCKSVMENYFLFVNNTLENLQSSGESMLEKELKLIANSHIINLYPWISKWNLKKLFSQSCYYALKEGLDKTIS